MRIATAFLAVIAAVMSIGYGLLRVRAPDWGWLTGEGPGQNRFELLQQLPPYFAAAIGVIAAVLALRLWENTRAVVACSIMLMGAAVLIAVTGRGASTLQIGLFGIAALLALVRAALPRRIAGVTAVSSTPLPANTKSGDEDVAARMRELPRIALKKALRIERNFLAWSQLTGLWVLFGLFSVFMQLVDAVDPISPQALRVDAVVASVAWAILAIAQHGLSERKARGPWCLLAASTILLLRDIGMLVIGSPLHFSGADFRIVIGIRLLFMLAMLPLFEPKVRIYLMYTALDKGCFKKGGVAPGILQA